MKLVIVIFFIVLLLIMFVSFIIDLLHIKSITKSNYRAEGTVSDIFVRQLDNNLFMYTLTIDYTVNGITYNRKMRTSEPKYKTGQKLEIIYLEKNPQRSYAIEDKQYLEKPKITLMCLTAFVFIFSIVILSLDIFQEKLFDIVFIAILAMASIGCAVFQVVHNFLKESSLQKLTSTIKGTVISAYVIKKAQNVIAEYTVDGKSYITRTMKIPQKHGDKFLNEGDIVDVMYDNVKLSRSIIFGDNRLANAKKALVYMGVLLMFAAIYFIIHFLV